MKILLQRVSKASVQVESVTVGTISHGILAFVGITHSDTSEEMKWLADKLVKLRIFPDDDGKMNKSVQDIGGEILLISQFTLYGDTQKGLRPNFTAAARPEVAQPLYNQMIDYLRTECGVQVQTGIFGAMMEVSLVNDGPVTLEIEKTRSES